MLSILGFLVVLGPLVVFHEFGHYLFARIFGVKAEIFSVGFGPRIWSKQIGETEWRLSLIPMGGYVKLLGEEGDKELSPEDQKRALGRQAPWKRFCIFFAGPLFNFILSVVVFMAILVIGEPQMSSTIGRVVKGSPAEKAGFESGDRVTKVNSKGVRKYEEVMSIVNESPNLPVTFEVIHPKTQAPATITVTASAQQGFSIYGEATHVGEIDGLFPMGRASQTGVSDPASLAGKAGIKTGEKITELNGKPLVTWEELDRVYDESPANTTFSVKTDAGHLLQFTKLEGKSLGEISGLFSSELFIEKTVPKSPAETAGIKPGDRLYGVGDIEVKSFFGLKDAVQQAGESSGKVVLRWERAGQKMTADIVPTATQGRDPILKKTTQFTVGIMPQLVWAEPNTFVERVWNPFTLVYKATERMVVFSWRNLVSIRKMFTGDVSVATLGGPILIGKIAGESLSRGLIAFLTTMAILSVGLGVLNVLPVPVLDGGHLLLLVIEMIRGKPLTMRQMEIVQQVGLSLILLLMVVVIRNDLARLTIFD